MVTKKLRQVKKTNNTFLKKEFLSGPGEGSGFLLIYIGKRENGKKAYLNYAKILSI